MTTDLAKARESILGTIPPAGGPDWLRTLREGAFAHFKTQGFPTPKNERWKYTDLSLYWPNELPGAGKPAQAAPLARLKAQGFDVEKGHWLVFIDGIHSPGQSSAHPLPAGLRAGAMASMLEDPSVRETLGRIAAPESDALTALNLAAFRDGAFLQVAAGAQVPGTIHLVFVSTQPAPAFARNLVLAGDNSRLSLAEHFLGDAGGPSLFSSVTELKLAPGAQVDHVKIQQGSTGQLHFGTVQARQEAG
ncbi:MAG TPA: SufD family Fe-S cluster assembly protein, partial [bacterium]|nr:SufD family Fe-S cluster assembly protein [bacterium]